MGRLKITLSKSVNEEIKKPYSHINRIFHELSNKSEIYVGLMYFLELIHINCGNFH